MLVVNVPGGQEQLCLPQLETHKHANFNAVGDLALPVCVFKDCSDDLQVLTEENRDYSDKGSLM